MYKVYEAEGIKFYVKFDDIDGVEVPHMFRRHSVNPKEAITAYFNPSSNTFNTINKRFELYSAEVNVTVYYAQRHNKDNEILLITAIKGEIQ